MRMPHAGNLSGIVNVSIQSLFFSLLLGIVKRRAVLGEDAKDRTVVGFHLLAHQIFRR
jgi:hypothetical protein